MEKADPKLLLELIKEDRNEIRIVKARIYTYIQALIVAAFALTAFFINKCTVEGVITLTANIKSVICVANLGFLLLSWGIFWVLNKDLHFVRECLTWREAQLKEATGHDYFGDVPDVNSPLSRAILKKCWDTGFKNDGLLFFLMLVLSAIYAGVTVVVLSL
jgi:hypothetical protein